MKTFKDLHAGDLFYKADIDPHVITLKIHEIEVEKVRVGTEKSGPAIKFNGHFPDGLVSEFYKVGGEDFTGSIHYIPAPNADYCAELISTDSHLLEKTLKEKYRRYVTDIIKFKPDQLRLKSFGDLIVGDWIYGYDLKRDSVQAFEWKIVDIKDGNLVLDNGDKIGLAYLNLTTTACETYIARGESDDLQLVPMVLGIRKHNLLNYNSHQFGYHQLYKALYDNIGELITRDESNKRFKDR